MKNSLTKEEFWFLRMVYQQRHYDGGISISEILGKFSSHHDFHETDYYVEALAKDNVLSISPDGFSFKITDFGVELLEASLTQEKEWEKPGIIRVTQQIKGEILIPAGAHFAAQRVIKEIFGSAKQYLDIIDPYAGASLFDRINDADINASIRIITTDLRGRSYYEVFRQNYPAIEMRVLAKDLHDRFVLIDRSSGYHVGHSLKDLGKKDTRISRLTDVKSTMALFEQRWSESKPI